MPIVSRRLWSLVAVLGCSLMAIVGVAGTASASATVSGGGSTFAAPELQQWSADVNHAPYNLNVNYAVSSSGAGRDDYAQGLYQYGASDIVYYAQDGTFAQQASSQHPFKYVTVSAGGLAFMYNIIIGGQHWTGLQLTRQEVCQIFTGKLTNWNQLASTPGDAVLSSVNQDINVVVRQDAAGESYVLSQYCLAVDPGDWAGFQSFVDSNANENGQGWAGDADMSIGKPIENWPPLLEDTAGSNQTIRASGATAEVTDITDPNIGGYSIGYLATAYAAAAGYPVASVENAAGYFVQPTANSVQIALSYAKANSLGTFDLDFTGPSADAYFPSTYSYVLAPTTTNGPTNAGADATLAAFLCYAVGQGQNDAARETYAPLSAAVTQLSVQAIQAIPGAPAASGCGLGGPAPVVQTGGGGVVVIKGNNGGGDSNKTTTGQQATGPTGSSGSGAGSSTGNSSGGTGTSSSGGSSAGSSSGASSSGAAGPSASGASAAGSAGHSAASSSAGRSSLSGSGLGSGSGPTNLAVASSPTSVAIAASTPGTTNFESYWYLIAGAIVCAIGTLAVGARRKAVQ